MPSRSHRPDPDSWIEIAENQMAFKPHYKRWSGVWFTSLSEAYAWILKSRISWTEPQPEKKVVDAPKAKGVKAH